MSEAFYVPDGPDRFVPTKHTVGPWSPDAQHFGPPSALLVRSLERLSGEDDRARLAKITVDILGPAPLSPMTVRARVDRPGRSVELRSAELIADDRVVAKASAWRIATSDTRELPTGSADPLPPVAGAPAATWPPSWGGGGFLDGVEWRAVAGSLDGPGPATAWARQHVELVEGEETTALERLFAIADCGNGASNMLDPSEWLFINTDLTVHLQRAPIGEWIGLDASTIFGPDGVGTARTVLHDETGPVAIGAQALLVRPR